MLDPAPWFFIFVRASAMLSVFPVFGTRACPVQIRIALAGCLSFLVLPLLPSAAPSPASLFEALTLLSWELSAGLLLGFISRMLFFALDLAGGIISAQIGLSFPSEMNPFTEGQTMAPSLILYHLAIVLWLTLDFHHWLLYGFVRAYHFLPIGAAELSSAVLANVLKQSSAIFFMALQMSAPVIALSFLITLAFAVLGRAVPQMNVFLESFAFRILSGLAVLGLTLNLMSEHIANYLRRLPEDMLRLAQLLGA